MKKGETNRRHDIGWFFGVMLLAEPHLLKLFGSGPVGMGTDLKRSVARLMNGKRSVALVV